jgi:levanase
LSDKSKNTSEGDALLPRDASPRVVSGAHTVPRTIYRPIERELPPGTRVLYDFEQPTWAECGFTVTGDAWGKGPRRGAVGQPPLGWGGAFYASSSTIGDRGTGRLVSSEFELDGARLTLRVGGGSLPGVRVELHDAATGAVLFTARGAGNSLARVTWELGAARGKRARLDIVDEEKGVWGVIWVDDVRLEGTR